MPLSLNINLNVILASIGPVTKHTGFVPDVINHACPYIVRHKNRYTKQVGKVHRFRSAMAGRIVLTLLPLTDRHLVRGNIQTKRKQSSQIEETIKQSKEIPSSSISKIDDKNSHRHPVSDRSWYILLPAAGTKLSDLEQTDTTAPVAATSYSPFSERTTFNLFMKQNLLFQTLTATYPTIARTNTVYTSLKRDQIFQSIRASSHPPALLRLCFLQKFRS